MRELTVPDAMDHDSFGQCDVREIEVEFPPELLDEIDEYAVNHGFRSPSDVVRAALDSA